MLGMQIGLTPRRHSAPTRRGWRLLWLLLAAAFWSFPAAAAGEDKLGKLQDVLADLKKGGLVVYFRHSITDTSQTDAAADLARCETQRNLSEAGRAQATKIGQAFKALGIPVGEVLSSPFCRTKDTAQLAFGHFTVSDDLFFASNAPKDAVARMTASLRRMLSTRPADGANSIVVSHTSNLREAAGIWPKPEGVAIVFRPLGDGRFEALARIPPEDWGAAAGS